MATSNSQRMALQEITAVAERSNPTPSDHTVNVYADLPLTPVSPDEELIRSRGRYRCASYASQGTLDEIQLTPKKVGKSPRKSKTPQKMTPSKTPMAPIRTSPRKRLNMQEVLVHQMSSNEASPSSLKYKRSPVKRMRMQTPVKSKNIEGTLSTLSHSQLVDLMRTLIIKHPEIQDTVEKEIPTPDLSPIEEKLNTLQRNIFRSIPSTRWESNRDSFCFRRTSSHLEAFKKECVDQGRKLIQHKQWQSALDYVLMAWRYVRALPDWDNPAHNKAKGQCYKALASVCLSAIKNGNLEESDMMDMLDRLSNLTEDSQCLSLCLKELEEKLEL